MKITLELTPDLEAKLRDSAARQDDAEVRSLLAEALAPAVRALLAQPENRPSLEEFEALADELAREFEARRDPQAKPLSDYAVNRKGMYDSRL
jgi:hypothetical protein